MAHDYQKLSVDWSFWDVLQFEELDSIVATHQLLIRITEPTNIVPPFSTLLAPLISGIDTINNPIFSQTGCQIAQRWDFTHSYTTSKSHRNNVQRW